MSITRADIRADAYVRFPKLGRNITLDAAPSSNSYVTSAANWTDSRLGSYDLADRYIYLPGESGANAIKRTTTVDNTNGRLSVQSAYSSATTTAAELAAIDPTLLNNAIKTAQRRVLVRDLIPFTDPSDGDMRTSGAGTWSGTNASLSKVTTAANVFAGTQSLRVALSGASGYARGATVRVSDTATCYTAIIGRADVGTLSFNNYDVTGSAVFSGTAPSYVGERFAMLERNETPPSGCEEMKFQPTGSGASDDLYIDSCFGPYLTGKREYIIRLSGLDQGWKVVGVRPIRYQYSLSGGSNAGAVYDAQSGESIGDLEEGLDFELIQFPQNANPNRIRFFRDLEQTPHWLVVERPSYDADGAATTESATISLTLEEFMPYVMEEIMAILSQTDEGKNDTEIAAELRRYQKLTSVQTTVRTKHVEQSRKSYRNLTSI